MPGTQDLKRLHSLDALRAAMMLLGLVLHSAASYTTYSLEAAWPYQDAQRSGVADWLVFVIHLFRMPTFFVMAGFFAAFLLQREGVPGFLAHRVKRLLLPFIAGWIVVFPLVRAGFAFATFGGGSAGLDAVRQVFTTSPYGDPSLAHLWFIYYLMIYCLAAALVAPVLKGRGASAQAAAGEMFGRLLPTFGGCVLLGALTAVTLLPMEKPGLDTAFQFVPAPRVLLAYAVFFGVGWFLYTRRDLVPGFAHGTWRYLPAAMVVSIVYMVIVVSYVAAPSSAGFVAAVAAAGLATWLWIYGIVGLFVRYCDQPRPVQRYLSDASYWMYIVHLPFAIWLPGLLASSAMPGLAKLALVLLITTAVTVGSYHLFVRSTAIGQFLNGRKFSRGVPLTTRADAPLAR